MSDILGLLKSSIPLQQRYDSFVLWISKKNNNVPDLLAFELEVDTGVVEVFFELGNLDDDEFEIIDQSKLDISEMFIFVRFNRSIRNKVYEKAAELLASPQPLSAIKAFIDKQSQTNIEELVGQVSPKCWSAISKYLKDRDIVNGTITRRIRSMFVNVAKGTLTGKMTDWIIRAIFHDKEKELGIFTSELIKQKYPTDYQLFVEIRDNLESYYSQNDK
jgi:hypothetical protein